MKQYFDPGFKRDSLILVGSQSLDIWKNIPQEQAMEGFYLAAAFGNNMAVVRNIDPEYIEYWKALTEHPKIINVPNINPGEFLSQVIIDHPEIQETIKQNALPNSYIMVFLITEHEEKMSEVLHIPLHGSRLISNAYGTKSGIRKLIQGSTIHMPPGFVCVNVDQMCEAVLELQKNFQFIVIKHDLSVSGYLTKKIDVTQMHTIKKSLQEIFESYFHSQTGNYVVEGWVQSNTSLCGHIEILDNHKPILCAGWQQLIAHDGISYIGSRSLQLSAKAFGSFYEQLETLANLLAENGAVGSFGPDFIVADDTDTALLIELNARVPYTAFPIELIKHIRGGLGEGFASTHVKTGKELSWKEIMTALSDKKLLITARDTNAVGVVPFNVGMLPWKTFDIAVMADTFEQTKKILDTVQTLFE